MKHLVIYPVVITLLLSCNTYSVFEKFEKDPEGLEEIALLLENNNPGKAKSLLLKKVPAPAGTLLIAGDLALSTDSGFSDYVTNLASSMQGVSQGTEILSMYATAEAQTQGVIAIDFIADLVVIDAEYNSSSLHLVPTDDEAIQRFYPAMPVKCNDDSVPIQYGLDKAMAIILATAVLGGFNPDEVTTKMRELRAAVSNPNMLNNAIFSIVNFVCPSMNYDTDGDTVVSIEEADSISDENAEDFYKRSNTSIASVQAMVDANPDDKNLKKALERMEKYKGIIDNDDGSTLAERVRSFLVSQSDRD